MVLREYSSFTVFLSRSVGHGVLEQHEEEGPSGLMRVELFKIPVIFDYLETVS